MMRFYILSILIYIISACTNDLISVDSASIGNESDGGTKPAYYDQLGAYTMPYVRYDSSSATIGDGAMLQISLDHDWRNIASEASDKDYVVLSRKGSYVEWVATNQGNGVTVRFNVADEPTTGNGKIAKIRLYVNSVATQFESVGGERVDELELNSYYAYQYFSNGEPFRSIPLAEAHDGHTSTRKYFDETHSLITTDIKVGDIIRLELSSDEMAGVDFIEIESVEPPIKAPSGAISARSFGVIPNDGIDDVEQMQLCINSSAGSVIYLERGEYEFSDELLIDDNITILGAGMWYTNLLWTDISTRHSGFWGRGSGNRISNLYMNSLRPSRAADPGLKSGAYNAFGGTWSDSKIERVWAEHFAAAIFTGMEKRIMSDNFHLTEMRLRNNYATGCNLSLAICNSSLSFSSVRNNGDDNLAIWCTEEGSKNVSYYNNTVEYSWRASGIGFFGSGGHHIYNNIIRGSTGAAGIRTNGVFAAIAVDPHNPSKIENCLIEDCGTREDAYGGIYGALDIEAKPGRDETLDDGTIEEFEAYDIQNLQIRDLVINNSAVDAIRFTISIPQTTMKLITIKGITLENITIDGTGKDGRTSNVGSTAQSHRGSGVFCSVNIKNEDQRADDGEVIETPNVYLDNIRFSNCASNEILNIGDRFKIN